MCRGGYALPRGRGWRAWEDLLDLGVGPRDDVDRDEFAHAARRGRTSVGGRLDGTDVAADHHGHVGRPDVLLGDQLDVGGLDHGVGGFHRTDQSTGFHESQRVVGHVLAFRGATLTYCPWANNWASL
jgi:hypothetical protein